MKMCSTQTQQLISYWIQSMLITHTEQTMPLLTHINNNFLRQKMEVTFNADETEAKVCERGLVFSIYISTNSCTWNSNKILQFQMSLI
jgi:hypothetical protein